MKTADGARNTELILDNGIWLHFTAIGLVTLLSGAEVFAKTYSVGPGQAYESIGDAPLDSLSAGDILEIHWRSNAYQEKFVIAAEGTEAEPVTIRGVPNEDGELPIIDGRDAVTSLALDFWNEPRGLVKIGGSNSPSCDPPGCVPSYIVIENLDLRSARPPYTFTNADGGVETYADNAASLYVEVGAHLTIRNCVLHDSGNGLFIGAYDGETKDILVEGNRIYDNGIEGSIYEHNSYTAARGIVFQYNHYGSLRPDCGGNNLKDRSAGLVVRYNWIENGNRQLDLVDGEDTPAVPSDPAYRETYVYGNVLLEADGEGNSQIVHYGGDSGIEDDYRKGTLYFYNNTVVSTRSGNTTLFRLSTNDEHCDARNNIFHVSEASGRLAILDDTGTISLTHNWIAEGWTGSHGTVGGSIDDDGTNIEGDRPGFEDETAEDFHLADDSVCINAGTNLNNDVAETYELFRQYVKHTQSEPRPIEDPLDLGAFENCLSGNCETADPIDNPGGSSGGSGPGIDDVGGEGGQGIDDGGDKGCGCATVGRQNSFGVWSVLVSI
jgi:hypothetical protein